MQLLREQHIVVKLSVQQLIIQDRSLSNLFKYYEIGFPRLLNLIFNLLIYFLMGFFEM